MPALVARYHLATKSECHTLGTPRRFNNAKEAHLPDPQAGSTLREQASKNERLTSYAANIDTWERAVVICALNPPRPRLREERRNISTGGRFHDGVPGVWLSSGVGSFW